MTSICDHQSLSVAKKALKIVTIVGARPQFVKAAVVSRAIQEHNLKGADAIREIIIHTGQHFDHGMSQVFFDEMEIPEPDYNLGINGLSHGAMTGQMLEQIESVLTNEAPDWVLVYGDTNSTLAGALAAKKLHVKIAHVEAGLRSFNMAMPEEVNRILTDRISDILFCPTETAVNNLMREGFPNQLSASNCQRIANVGDVMYDAACYYSDKAKPVDLPFEGEFVLTTVHRAENTDDPERLRNIFDALIEISKETPVVLPLHPRTKTKLIELDGVYKELLSTGNSQLITIEPASYLEMIYLLKNCKMVMTDSGGLQKEAFFFEKPCVTLRDETEWVELVEQGVNKLAGASTKTIVENYAFLNSRLAEFGRQLYGNGNTGKKIVDSLLA